MSETSRFNFSCSLIIESALIALLTLGLLNLSHSVYAALGLFRDEFPSEGGSNNL